ncbi:MAG TPA: cytochrome c oxidase assembly protein [Solirubrobacteraceae bacterium]
MSAQPPTLERLLGTWTIDPVLLCVLGVAAGLYLWGVWRAQSSWPIWRLVSFLAGLCVLPLALLSGIDEYADELLSVHVIEHLLLILIAPTLLLWGAPVRLALKAARPAWRRALAVVLRSRPVRLLTRPACGFVLFTLAVLATHLTGVYEAALHDQTLHALEHAAYFWTGTLFLLPLIAADPIPRPPGAIARFSWLMAAMVVMSIPAGVFLFDEHARYPFYSAPARALHVSALADQQTAGVLMLVGGGVVMGVLAIVIAMSAMLAEERRQQRRDRYADRSTDARRLPARELAGR